MGNKIIFDVIDIKTFIKNHTHIYYCEAIIFPDGRITYAVPSHIMCLEKISKLTRNELMNLIINESFDYLDILLNYTKCVSVWYNFYKGPTDNDITEKQKNSLELLQSSGCCNFKR